MNRWVSADPLTIHGLGADLNLYAYVSGMALKATDPLGLECVANQSCEATASTSEGGVQYGGGGEATVARHTQGPATAAKPGRSIPAPPPVAPSLPRVPLGLLGRAREDVGDIVSKSTNALEIGAGSAAWLFLAGAATIEEVPRLVLNLPSNAEMAGQHFARAAYVEGGAEKSLEILSGVKSLASAAEGALIVAAPLAAGESSAAKSEKGAGPVEAYDRVKHYGRTPTKADRKALGAGPDDVVDHTPPLVKRYYEGDPSVGEKKGLEQTAAERRASASDRSRMRLQPKKESQRQGRDMQRYSMEQKKKLGL